MVGDLSSSPLAVGAAVAVVLCSLVALLLRRARASYPSWDTISDDTLKVGGSKKKLEEFASKGPIDYIIIGSGLGGLTCASLLAKVGYRVLVLEQHDVAGGATHTFSEQGFTWDVGVHYCGERLASRWSPVRRLFDAASDGKLEWSACHQDYDHAVNVKTGEDIPMNRDPARKLERLRAAFPDVPPAAWGRYRRACRVAQLMSGGAFVAMKVLPRWLLRLLGPPLLFPLYSWAAGRSAKEVMANCGLSPDAIGGASYLYGDYGLPPGEVPFLVQALLETHYDGGGYFPRGGSGSIAKTIVAAIVRRGGAVMVRAPVSEVTVTNRNGGAGNRATGVVCRGVALAARHGVVSNAGAFNTYERLLPPAVAAPALDALKATPGAFEPSVQLLYLFVGLDGSDEELKLPGANFWLLHGWDHDANWKLFNQADSYEDLGFLPAVFLSFGSAKDDHHATVAANKQKATLQLLAPVRFEWFDGVAKKGSKIKHRGAACT
jgi:all-trans-retinol 13,14-reductase